MQQAHISAIEYHLPEQVVTNADLAAQLADFPAAKIFAKTGIAERRIAASDECASDLAAQAAEKLFASGVCRRQDIDALLFCSQSPDYLLPSTACLLQDRLRLPTTVAALDFTLGCSGFVYGLGLAKGMIESGQVNNVLMLTADTYSKFIHPDDRSVRSLFGDGGAATLIAGKVSPEHLIGPFVYGTDGSGAEHLIVRGSGARSGGGSPAGQLCMNGPEIFNFTLEAVPTCVKALLARANVSLDVVDLFVFHQANAYMLEHLRLKLELPAEKFFVFLENCGNTVSSSIPIAIKEAMLAGRLRPGMTVMLVGFGVGLSWAATIVKW